MNEADRLDVERLGGLAGFGGGHLRSVGKVWGHQLTAGERQRMADLMSPVSPTQGHATPAVTDGFRYRLTLAGQAGSVEVAEAALPAVVRDCVQDELL
jgi:hypothetical protein